MKIAVVTTSLIEGGAQRVAATLANSWQASGHAVEVITFQKPSESPEFPLVPGVVLTQLSLAADSRNVIQSIAKNLKRVRVLRAHLRKNAPDVVLALITGPNIVTVLAGKGCRWPTVISERVHPAYQPIEKSWDALRRWTYPCASAIVVQSTDIAQWFKSQLGLSTIILPNPIDLEKFPAIRKPKNKTRLRAIAAGRLDPQKGFDLLIEAFSDVASANPDWDLVIYGRGQERQIYQDLINSRSMQSRIELAGTNFDIASAYGEADLFVHSARYEGYPNVIQEALAAGLPVVATDCPGATRDLLGDGRYGVLVKTNSADALKEALASILPDATRRRELAENARSAVSAFDADLVAKRWLDLFETILKARSR